MAETDSTPDMLVSGDSNPNATEGPPEKRPCNEVEHMDTDTPPPPPKNDSPSTPKAAGDMEADRNTNTTNVNGSHLFSVFSWIAFNNGEGSFFSIEWIDRYDYLRILVIISVSRRVENFDKQANKQTSSAPCPGEVLVEELMEEEDESRAEATFRFSFRGSVVTAD